MAITQKQSVDSHKAETHLSAGEQLICIIPLPFHLQPLLVSISPFTWEILEACLVRVQVLQENHLFPEQSNHLYAQHFSIDGSTWSWFYLNAEHIIRVCSQGWGWGGDLPCFSRPKDLQQMTEVLCSRWTGAPHVCNQKKVPGDPVGHQHIYKTISYMKSTIHIYCNGKHDFQKFSKPLRCPSMSTSPPETSKYSTLPLWWLKDEEAAKEVMHFLTFDTIHVTSILVWRASSLIPLFHVSLSLSQTAQCLWEQPSRSGTTTIWYKLMGKNNLFFSFPIKLHWKKIQVTAWISAEWGPNS